MGRHLLKFGGAFEVVILFKLLTICMNVTTSFGQSGQSGFVSIDYGSNSSGYTDDIGLSWFNDETYIFTRSNSDRPLEINKNLADHLCSGPLPFHVQAISSPIIRRRRNMSFGGFESHDEYFVDSGFDDEFDGDEISPPYPDDVSDQLWTTDTNSHIHGNIIKAPSQLNANTRMGRHLFKFGGAFEVVMLFKLFTICMNVTTSYGQSGFLSMDCGSTRGSYIDDIGLNSNWVVDETYILTGSNSNLKFFEINLSIVDDVDDYTRVGFGGSSHGSPGLPTSLTTSFNLSANLLRVRELKCSLSVSANLLRGDGIHTNWMEKLHSSLIITRRRNMYFGGSEAHDEYFVDSESDDELDGDEISPPYLNDVSDQVLTSDTNSHNHDKMEKKIFLLRIIGGIIGGVVLLVILCVLFVLSWKLWKEFSTRHQIQQALMDRKVEPPFYTYTKLKLATKGFHKDNKLGNGAFGVVYKGVLADGTTLAVKKLLNSQQVQVLNEFLNEVELITGIKHRNLVQLKGCCINDKERILVYEHVENGNLAEALWGKKTFEIPILDWQKRFSICVGIARGLLYLHEELQPRIVHRDIKPTNILLDKNFNPKIADFGLAKHILDEESQVQFTCVVGTWGYFAPEYACGGKLTEKADVYSFGILVLEIVRRRKVIGYNKPLEKVFLQDWVQNLHKDGMLLEVLQPELGENYEEDEVMRVLNPALICVQMDPERHATMSQVITMLLGNMDVKTFLDMGKHHQPDFYILLATNNDHSVENISTFHNVIVEESVDLESSLPRYSNISTHSIATVELSDMSGR